MSSERRTIKELADQALSLIRSHPDLFRGKFDSIDVHVRCCFNDIHDFDRRTSVMNNLVKRGVVRKCWQRGKYELVPCVGESSK
jgi:hypothetical protein